MIYPEFTLFTSTNSKIVGWDVIFYTQDAKRSFYSLVSILVLLG